MARIEIRRDAHGVPSVKAATARDAFHGLGIVHARDRMLAMQVMKLFGEGRMAECVADVPLLVAYDVKLRGQSFVSDSRAQAETLDGELAALLDAYTEGVNAELRRGHRSLEMRIVGLRPERWEPWHSILVLKVMSFVGLGEIQEDLERFVIEAVRRGTDPELLKELFHPYLEGMDAELVKSVGRMEEVPTMAGVLAGAGSNAFAVAGSHSVTGHALLGNDPHLQVNRLPAVWMEVMVTMPHRTIVGSTLPGGPGFVSARTQDLAWGVTYSMADVVDFWVEDVRDDRVRRGEDWVPLQVRRESVGRKGGAPMSVTIRESELGVIEGEGDGRHFALGWVGRHASGAATFRALHELLSCTSVKEAMAAIRNTDLPPLNWIVADRAGNVAWQLGGRYAVRRPGWSGLYPVAGWDVENAWRGWRDGAGLPFVENPDRGVVVTANHNRNDPGQPPYISVPHPDCRAKRIEKILRPPGKVTLEMLRTAQLDVKSLQAERLLPRLLPHCPEGPEKTALQRWDLRYVPTSREATLFENLWRESLLAVFGDGGLGRDWLAELLCESGIGIFLFGNFDDVLSRGDSRWLPKDRRDSILREAARRAFGDPWPPWGERTRFSFDHMLLGGRLPRVAGFDKGPFPVTGSRATPRQGSLYRKGGRDIFIAASYRFLADVGDDMTVETCLPGGPTERRLSRGYASEIRDWLEGRYKKLSPDGPMHVEEIVE